MRSKWWLRSWTGLLLVFILFASSMPAASASSGRGNYVPGELIIGMALRSSAPEFDMAQTASQLGAVIKDASMDHAAYLLSFKSEAAASHALDVLKLSPGVKFVERNGIAGIPPLEPPADKSGDESLPSTLLFNPNDTMRGRQWYLDRILHQLAPPPNDGVPCIVVLDTGVDYTHPDLSGKVYKGRDFFDDDADPMDAHGHGTHVAGIAAGKTGNSIGISGVSPRSNILAVRVLGPDGSGTWWDVAKGVQWANARDKAACGGQEPLIYNMSIGGDHSKVVSDAIAAALAKGRLVVAAAGNSNTSARSFPGDDPNAFGVAATEENDRRAVFSNYDTASDPWVDIAAPGFQILSTFPGGYRYLSGTSMATPVVAGLAARVWGKYPRMTVSQVRYRIQKTADPAQGFPRVIKRVNLYRALGGGGLVLQGRVLDSVTGGPRAGAAVTVTKNGVKVCAVSTSAFGLYTCGNLPAVGTYRVRASKLNRIATANSFQVDGSRFNANLTMTRLLGTSTSGDWTATTLWGGWQPFESDGLEADIWLVDPGANPVCYAARGTRQDQDAWNLLLPFDSSSRLSQTESAWIKRSFGGELQVWVTIWDGEPDLWPSSARLTGSQLQARIYKNNRLVSALTVPSLPDDSTADNWFVGTIDLNAGSWLPANQIKTDAQLPFCIQVP